MRILSYLFFLVFCVQPLVAQTSKSPVKKPVTQVKNPKLVEKVDSLSKPVSAKIPVKVPKAKIDCLITPTDTLVFIKQPVIKLSKPEMLVKQATEKQTRPLEAIVSYKKALAEKTSEQDSNWVGDIHLSMAKLYLKLKDYKRGFAKLLEAQKLFYQSNNIACQAAILNEVAAMYEKDQDWQEAEKYYLSALDKQESSGLIHDVPYTKLALAKGYYKKKEYEKANSILVSAINQFELNGERNKRGEAYLLLLQLNKLQEGFAQTENLILKRVLPYFGGVGDDKGKLVCFDMLGHIYQLQKRNSEAKWFFIQANTLSRANKDVRGIISSLINLSEIKSSIGDYKSALKDIREAEVLAKRKNSLPLMADVKLAYAFYNKAKAAKTAKSSNKLTVNSNLVKKVVADVPAAPPVKTGKL